MPADPFSTIIEIMRRQGAAYNLPGIMLAEVVSATPELLIKMGDLQLDKDNILIADYLVSGYNRTVSIASSAATGTTDNAEVGDHGSHNHNITNVGIPQAQMTFLDSLGSGDLLAVIPTSDAQMVIVLARVVKLT